MSLSMPNSSRTLHHPVGRVEHRRGAAVGLDVGEVGHVGLSGSQAKAGEDLSCV